MDHSYFFVWFSLVHVMKQESISQFEYAPYFEHSEFGGVKQ